MEVKVLENQSLFDLAIQACGSIEAVFGIAGLNGLSITDALMIGSLLELADDPEGGNTQISAYYYHRQLYPATEISSSGPGSVDVTDDGIGFMAVEIDNLIQ